MKKVKKKMTKKEIEEKKKKIKKTFFSVIIVIVVIFAALIINDYIILDTYNKTNLVINNYNITESLLHDVLIKDDIIFLSKEDISKIFDKYIYDEPETNQIITTYDKKVAVVGFEKNEVIINGSIKETYAHAIKENDVSYIPISEMQEVYNIEIQNIKDKNIITIDSLDKEQKRAIVSSDIAVKATTNLISRTVDRVKKGESVIVISSENGNTKIRTQNGKIGYVKSSKLENEYNVREDMPNEKQIEGTVNLGWDYYNSKNQAPNRSQLNIQDINAVTPAFLYLDNSGNLKENIGASRPSLY